MLLRLSIVLLALVSWGARSQPTMPALGHRDAAFVAATPHFRFHSDFWLNLHDYLYGIVSGGPGDQRLEAEETACFAALPRSQADAWEKAVAFYESDMAERHHRRDPLLRSVRYRLADLAPTHDVDPEAEALLDLLQEAAPAYRACLWETHDARNRARIAAVLRHVVRHGPALADTLGRLYGAGWPEGITVDVTPYASGAGANTTSGRFEAPHMMISNLDPDLEGYSGLELVFHEASHIVFGPNHGAVTGALGAAADALGVEVPRALWHAVSFHTSGWAVRQLAAAEGVSYEPYWFRHGVFAPYHEAMVAHWQPYLEGIATAEAAALALVRALTAP
jgi:hypothetical protein